MGFPVAPLTDSASGVFLSARGDTLPKASRGPARVSVEPGRFSLLRRSRAVPRCEVCQRKARLQEGLCQRCQDHAHDILLGVYLGTVVVDRRNTRQASAAPTPGRGVPPTRAGARG